MLQAGPPTLTRGCLSSTVLQVEEFCYITDNTYTREQVRAEGG